VNAFSFASTSARLIATAASRSIRKSWSCSALDTYAGATVLRGILGFGANSKLHSDRFVELSMDLPVVIECIETEERIEAILPELDGMLGGGVITLERTKVIMYRGDVPPEKRTGSWPIDTGGLENE